MVKLKPDIIFDMWSESVNVPALGSDARRSMLEAVKQARG